MNFFLYKKNFALDGQTRWAKSFLQPVNLPSAQPLMKSMQFKNHGEQKSTKNTQWKVLYVNVGFTIKQDG